jgi:hypothetical protein
VGRRAPQGNAGGDHAIHQGQIANSLISTFGGVFAGTYTARSPALRPPSLQRRPAAVVYQHARGGLASLFDLSRFGVNVDGIRNDRLYDDRFLTGDADKTCANGNNFSS